MSVSDRHVIITPRACLAARRLLGLSEAQLAEMSQVSLTSVRRLEAAQQNAPDLFVARKVAQTLIEQGVIVLGGKAYQIQSVKTSPGRRGV